MPREIHKSERHAALSESFPSCSGGDCGQGRRKCSIPEACQIPVDTPSHFTLSDFLVSVVLVGVCLATVFLGPMAQGWPA